MNDKLLLENYTIVNDNIELVRGELGLSYLEALHYTLQFMLTDTIGDSSISTHLQESLFQMNKQTQNMADELVRKLIQLLLLQATKQDDIQANHHITPDTIAFMISFILTKIVKEKAIALFDICVGCGNLISVLYEQLKDKYHVQLFGSEVDDLLINIADVSLQLQHIPIHLKHQDSVKPLLMDKPNVVVSDLPIGFYPDDAVAKYYEVAVNDEYTYAHHLLIEHSLQILSDNGWGIFIVPSNVFETKQGHKLLTLVTKNNQYYLQGFLALPKTMFRSINSRKSILFIQKSGSFAKKARTTLIGEIPSLKNPKAIKYFMDEIEKWSQSL